MAPKDTNRPRLTNADARRFFLHKHCLCDMAGSSNDLKSLIARLGFVQVDAINTVERAHHMILSSRRKPYRPKHLKALLERDRALFEHWTHDASVIPVQFFPYWRRRFARDAERLPGQWRDWQGQDFNRQISEVLERVEKDGPTMAREVGEGEVRQEGMMMWRPSKVALEYLWRSGKLSITRREGFQKVFDLTERVIPSEHLAHIPSEEEMIDWACTSALDRLGFATHGEIAAFWDLIGPAEAKAWVAQQRDLIEVDVECAGGEPRTAYIRLGCLDDVADAPDPSGGVRIMSPFDPALRDRKRAKRLFGFDYRIEIFVPAPKRIFGYYVFPVMEGARVIGRIDMRRINGILEVQAFWPEPGVKLGKARLQKLQAELDRVGRFGGCGDVELAKDWIKEPVVEPHG
ncbi:MAG: crosslink repair DNA glycosylase YcaQ family protein [Pseudomonadota bacterium]